MLAAVQHSSTMSASSRTNNMSYADIAKSMKQEGGADADTVSEAEQSRGVMKEAPSDDAMVSMSPSYMSEATDAFGNSSYQPLSQPASVKSASAGSTAGTVATVGTAATAGASWTRASHVRFTGSDTGSLSNESRSSQRNPSMREVQTHKNTEVAPAPQHGMGAQYLDPAPYVSAVGMPGVLPLSIPPMPVIVSSDQAQMQLQRKHEELQQMIVRQQEELRQVKEQLLLARLGILQPLINVQGTYVNPEDIQNNQRSPAQILYEGGTPRAITGYPPQHPPHSGAHHQHMPQ